MQQVPKAQVPAAPQIVNSRVPISSKPLTTTKAVAKDADGIEITDTEVRDRTNIDYVAKFGGSSVANAERMVEVYKLIKEQYVDKKENVALILSAMGKTTNNLLASGQKALKEGVVDIKYVKELTDETMKKLDIPEAKKEIDELLNELQSLLTGVTMLKELSPRSNDYLVSFGERISTRIFTAYLNKQGIKAVQFDAYEMGFVTNDEFMNAEIDQDTYKLVKSTLKSVPKGTIPVITGFIGRGK